MKVGIMTWFQYHNYGTALQVTAISKAIEKLGHSPYIINYHTNGQIVKKNNEGIIREGCIRCYQRVGNHFYQRYELPEREKCFDDFYREYLKFTNPCDVLPQLEKLNNQYDVFICGSDQVWAPSLYNPHYYLDFVYDENRMIAYAPSVGLSDIADENIRRRIKENVSRFAYLSTREKSGSKMLSELIQRPVATVLDPTLLLSNKVWNLYESSFAKDKKPYMLVYMLGKREEYWSVIGKIAKHLSLEIKIIPVFYKDLKRKGCIEEPVGPKDFLSLIHNAAYVCTDSFHGLAFSVNYNKNFTVFERFKSNDKLSQNSRIYNLLDILELENRLYSKNYQSCDVEIKYEKVNCLLETERSNSLNYLKSALESIGHYVSSVKRPQHIFQGDALCCGCGACQSICPMRAIVITQNRDGFYVADVMKEKCISCGKCKEVCPYLDSENSCTVESAQLYSYKDKDMGVLTKSSSGGMAYRLAELALEYGCSAIGCKMDFKSHRTVHTVIPPEKKNLLGQLQGSKYMQSEFSIIMDTLRKKDEKLVVFGIPCQIAGARKIVENRENVVLVDLICHGVPSYALYEKYLQYLAEKKKLEINEKFNTIFRYKPSGWRDIHIYNGNFNNHAIQNQKKDPYYIMFEHGFCYSKGCYECPWRDKSAADIRLGDYWAQKYATDMTGVSMVAVFTKRGEEWIDRIRVMDCGKLKVESVNDYFSCQQIKNNPRPVFWEELVKDLNSDEKTLLQVLEEYVIPFERRKKIRKYLSKIKQKV